MLYVSFVEIFATKSFEAWEDAGYSAAEGYRFSTMLFFAGMLLVFLLDRLVHLVADCASKRGKALCSASRANLLNNEDAEGTGAAGSKNNNDDNDTATAGPSSSSRAPSGTMSSVQRRTEILIEDMEEGGITKHNSNYNNSGLSERGLASLTAVNVTDIETSSQDNDNDNVPDVDCTKPAEQAVSPGREAPAVIEMIKNDPHCFALQKMGVLTAVSIAIHNFPEGLATFVAALADVKLGIGVAVAIAVHNVPEGICVAAYLLRHWQQMEGLHVGRAVGCV